LFRCEYYFPEFFRATIFARIWKKVECTAENVFCFFDMGTFSICVKWPQPVGIAIADQAMGGCGEVAWPGRLLGIRDSRGQSWQAKRPELALPLQTAPSMKVLFAAYPIQRWSDS
jgi:hypothetical protein